MIARRAHGDNHLSRNLLIGETSGHQRCDLTLPHRQRVAAESTLIECHVVLCGAWWPAELDLCVARAVQTRVTRAFELC